MATVYGPLDAPEVVKVYREFKELALVATSAEQVRQCLELNWQVLIPWNLGPWPLDQAIYSVASYSRRAGDDLVDLPGPILSRNTEPRIYAHSGCRSGTRTWPNIVR